MTVTEPAIPQEPWVPLSPLPVERWAGGLKAAFELFAPQALWIASAVQPVSVGKLSFRRVRDDYGPDSIGKVRVAWATMVAKEEDWIGGNPLRWYDHATGGDRPDYGGPKGVWPVLIGLTGWQRDRITARLPRDPYVGWALQRRIWTRSLDQSDDAWLLEGLVRTMLKGAIAAAPNRTELPHGYFDAGWLFEEERRDRRTPPDYFEQRYVLPAAKALKIRVWSEEGLRAFLEAAMRRSVKEHQGRARVHFAKVCADMLAEEAEAEAQRSALQARQVSALGEAVKPVFTRAAAHPARGFHVKQLAPEIARAVEEVRRGKAMAGE